MPSSSQNAVLPGRRVKETKLDVEELFLDVIVIDDDEPEPPPGGRCRSPNEVPHENRTCSAASER